VVCLNAPPLSPLENVIPSLFNMYPALASVPPVFALSVTVFPVTVQLNIDAPVATRTCPLNDPV
jgi:hypothetical protein